MGAACCGERQSSEYQYQTIEAFNRADYKEPTPEEMEKLRILVDSIENNKDIRVLAALLADKEKGFVDYINMRESTGFTPLLYGAVTGDVKKVSLLVENKAQVDVLEERGWSCLHLIAKSRHKDAAKVAHYLLAAGADHLVNYQDIENGKTALHYAAEANDAELISTLLDGGANMTITNKGGETPDMVTSDTNNQTMLRTKRRKSISSNVAPTPVAAA